MTNKEVNVDQELTSDVLKAIAGGPHIRTFNGFVVGSINRVGIDVGPVARRPKWVRPLR
ncbi:MULTISPECIES: hypothetical protein [unclassified Prochlorococcus]|uniref:hypothetical protein n=1 Tax=unclassified Prochlorococcus TaxID=2627481 RepID=UPI00053381BD|nr:MULTISPECIES: hypothetical protein [unclassified Prochlorococcus]KGG30630.1 hypothetical protein EV13_0135 [Prochlorococcus sp. MIT 0702]